MKKNLFGQNIYNFNSGIIGPWNQFTRWVERGKMIIICVIAIAVGLFLFLRTPIYTTQVDFRVTKVDTLTQIDYDANYRGSVSSRTTYDLQGSVGSECGTRVVTMLGYPYPVSVGQIIKAWVRPGCLGLDAKYGVDDTKLAGVVVIVIAVVAIIINR
jgi:hypothetical protein